MTVSIIIAVLSIIALLIIHESGHFFVAKLFKVRVKEFGVGLPPRLIGKKVGDTLYSINLLPFGAFVKIPDVEDGEEERKGNVAPWKKALILFAGSGFFWLAGFILLTAVFLSGAFQEISDEEAGNIIDPRVQITSIVANSPAEEAGLTSGDIIRKVSFQGEEISISKVSQIQQVAVDFQGEEISITVERKEGFSEVSLTPRISFPQGEGAIGLSLIRVAEKKYSFFQAITKGAEETIYLTVAIVTGLFKLLISLISGQGLPQEAQLMGPIGIGSMAAQAVEVGVAYFLQFIAIISIYLAVFNLLPIPALDGGRLLFLGIEKIKGSPVNRKLEQSFTAGFFILLIILIIFVTVGDIRNLF
jgi:regulator of sigma E protease